MKNILLFSFIAIFSASLVAQDSEFKAGHDGWLVDINEAYQLHEETGKPIMANFTGSDWCGWCKRLSASVFVHEEFKDWAKENVILLELDYPKRKKIPEKYRRQNAQLQQAFQVRGYPTIWVFELDSDSETGEFKINALGKTGYKPSVAQFTTDVDKIIAQAEKGNSEEQ